jgi:tetratricopeptide (TPR) repeat protein
MEEIMKHTMLSAVCALCVLLGSIGCAGAPASGPPANLPGLDEAAAGAAEEEKVRGGTETAPAHLNRGRDHLAEGRLDEAIGEFDKAVAIDSGLSEAFYYRGLAYSGKGDYDRAIADYDQAVRLDPNLAAAYVNRGSVYLSKWDYARTRADYEKALQIDPNNTTARDGLEVLRMVGH